MRDCQQSQALDILIPLSYNPSLNAASSHKNKTAIKQEVIGINQALQRPRQVSEAFVAMAALKHQAPCKAYAC